jgi:hypothetical protein
MRGGGILIPEPELIELVCKNVVEDRLKFITNLEE